MTAPFPARPINGGPYTGRPKPAGSWIYEPKVNGWRAVIHRPTGRMFNRHGRELSIASEFAPILDQLRTGTPPPGWHAPIWLDAEVFERRHPHGRGSLVLFDLIPSDDDEKTLAFPARIARLHNAFAHLPCFERWADLSHVPTGKLLMFDRRYSDGPGDLTETPGHAWFHLQGINATLAAPVFEGLVAKRIDRPYPFITRDDHETPTWVKHRWQF